MNVSNIDDDHTGFTPNLKSHQKMPEVTPSHDISDDGMFVTITAGKAELHVLFGCPKRCNNTIIFIDCC